MNSFIAGNLLRFARGFGILGAKFDSTLNLVKLVDTADNYANDAAAAAASVPIGGLYHTSGTVKVRLV